MVQFNKNRNFCEKEILENISPSVIVGRSYIMIVDNADSTESIKENVKI